MPSPSWECQEGHISKYGSDIPLPQATLEPVKASSYCLLLPFSVHLMKHAYKQTLRILLWRGSTYPCQADFTFSCSLQSHFSSVKQTWGKMRKEKHYIVSAFCFEEAQPHVVYNESSFNQGMLGEGGACFVSADSANWYFEGIVWGKQRVLCYVRHCQVIWQIPPWDALSDRLTESWTGQLPAEKLNLNTFQILWWPICGFGSRKKEDEK